MRKQFEIFFYSNILRLTIECQDKNGDNYKVYINPNWESGLVQLMFPAQTAQMMSTS